MYRVHAIAVLIVLLCVSVYGRDTVETAHGGSDHVIGLRFGMNEMKEENLVPLVHTGFIVTLNYEYRSEGSCFQRILLDLDYSRLETVRESSPLTAQLGLRASYSRVFGLIEDGSFNLLIGPAVGISFAGAYFPNWDDSHTYWATTYSLGATSMALWRLENGTRLLGWLSFPLLSLYSRPDPVRQYKLDDISVGGFARDWNSNLQAGFWNQAFFFRFSAEYQFPVFGTKMQAVSYSFGYSRVEGSGGNPVFQISHQIGLSVLL